MVTAQRPRPRTQALEVPEALESPFIHRPAFLWAILLTGGFYFLTAKLGLQLAYHHPSVTPVWPPTGIALAALVLLGRRLWPAIFAGAFFANLTTAGSVATSLGIACGNTLEAVLGAALACRFAAGRNAFDRPGTIFLWTLLAAGLAPLASALLGVASLTWGGYAPPSEFGPLVLTWWLGDASGALIVAPFLILWARNPRYSPPAGQILEIVIVGLALVLLCGLTFGVPFRMGAGTYPIPFTLPFLAWVAFRLGRRVTATAVVALSALAIWGTLDGQGLFAQWSKEESLLLLQIFLAVSSATALAVAASVQERKDVESSLALLASVVEFSEDAITLVNVDGTIVRWNRSAEQLYGWSERETRGRRISLIIPEELRRSEEAVFSRVSRGERIEHYETARLRKDGSRVDVSLAVSAVKDSKGRIIGISNTVRDVTERKRFREEILRLNAELEQRVKERTARLEAAIRELESFTYTVAHDLRAPLRGIHQYCDLLRTEKEAGLDEEGHEWLGRVAESARRMDGLIEGLLAYSRIGRADLNLSSLDLGAIVAEALAPLKAEIDARHAQVEVVPPFPRVRGNPLLLVQALTNLFSNAIKFVPPSRTPKVRISAVRERDRVQFSVLDNGIGIHPRHRDRLFRIFERLNPVEEYPGTGIGLAIVKKAVEQMGGSVGFESTKGQGTRFTLDLPAENGRPAGA